MDLKDIQNLIKFVAKSGASEVKLETEDVKITILDLPGQLNDARKNIREHGFEKRITGHPINLLDFSQDYPKDH